jgi:hypothetical protein
METGDLEQISALDRYAFGGDRGFFLRRCFERFPQLCMSMVKDRRVVGFLTGQPGRGLVTIGPWYFDGVSQDPIELLKGMALNKAITDLRIGALETNTRAVSLMRSLDSFVETKPSWRMVMGINYNLGASAKLFAVGSPSKG